ncbi:T9SS type B sorting domain-containing protein [Mucilaginibacter agri]|uniref:T9SS type B sorting domain-containing protein n=1 Tax=Mucilaginibacter agri TaxID=2695265 RepID=A0A965ZCZ3_9SPHI|nr:gliding motility-associated C-terminal domain-containing protein [Mucilaginibacter agri]NCD68748.1 T9SS type B sorting domain-containing protein [Mucilaginibacter agri]
MVNLKVITAFMVLLMLAARGSGANAAPLPAGQTVTIIQGQTATLKAAANPGAGFQWLKNGEIIAGAIKNTYVVNSPGSYQVMSTNSNCTSALSDPVNVIIQPNQASSPADMSIILTSALNSMNIDNPFTYTIMIKNNGPATANTINVANRVPDELAFQQLTAPAKGNAVYEGYDKKITWKLDGMSIGETASLDYLVKAVKQGTISSTATVSAATPDPDLSNNTATNTISIAGLTIPNVFTPNGDGVNDTFIIPGLGIYTANELTVMNRWGSTVYQKKAYNNEWNGEGLNEGTYFYLLKVQDANGKWDVYKGYITLLRTRAN